MSSPARAGSPAAALDDLDKSCLVRITDDIDDNLAAVVEGDLPGVNSLAVAAHRLSCSGRRCCAGWPPRFEAGEPDESAVIGHPCDRTEPDRGAGRQLLNPPVERGAYLSASDSWP
jgi:hypothetical protein